jgi:hypothetical protein
MMYVVCKHAYCRSMALAPHHVWDARLLDPRDLFPAICRLDEILGDETQVCKASLIAQH